MQSGELTVSGKDTYRIDLRGLPQEVRVHFVDDDCVTPCDPHHYVDSLEFEVHASNHNHHGFVLVISWEVRGVREIKWSAYY